MPAKVIYLAQPYTHSDQEVMEYRRVAGAKAAAFLMARGYAVFAPIAHGCAVVEHLTDEKVKSHDFWMSVDLPILERCDEMWVLPLPGVMDSRGAKEEMAHAEKRGIPVRFTGDEEDLFEAYLHAVSGATA